MNQVINNIINNFNFIFFFLCQLKHTYKKH